jgi:hypothetical protein
MPQIGDIYRAVLHWTLPEQVDAYNVLGLEVTAGSCSGGQLLTAAAAFLTDVVAELEDSIEANVDLVDCKLSKMIWTGVKWEVDVLLGPFFPTFAASGSDELLPQLVAAVTTFPTNVPKRRGRISWPGFDESQQKDGLLLEAAATRMATAAALLLLGFEAGDADVAYTILGHDGTTTIPDTASVNGVCGTQRRRKPGVGV